MSSLLDLPDATIEIPEHIKENMNKVDLGEKTLTELENQKLKQTVKLIKAYGIEQKNLRKKVDDLEEGVKDANKKDKIDIINLFIAIGALMISILSFLYF